MLGVSVFVLVWVRLLARALSTGRPAARTWTRVPAAAVHLCTAESMHVPSAAFDLAVAATSVHWLDLGVVLPKVHRALVPGGHLAVWRTAYGDPAGPVTPFRERVRHISARRGPAAARPGPGADRV